MKNDTSSGRRILVIRTSALGDVAMTVPVIYSVAKAYPEVELYVLTHPFFARLLVNAPQNVKLLKADIKKDYKGAWGLVRLLRHLSTYGFTDVADLHDVVRSWVIDAYFKISGKRVSKLNKDRRGRRFLLHRKEAQRPYIERYIDVFARLGLVVNMDFESVFGNTLPQCGIDISHPAVGIAPFARYQTKECPLATIEKAILLLPSTYTVCLFGAKADKPRLDELAEKIRHDSAESHKSVCTLLNTAGQYPIEEELKIMANMDVMVTMDSANQHLASLAGTRAITLWGSTVPYGGFLAYNQRIDDALYANLDCQPCTVAGSNKCKRGIDTACMLRLKPQILAHKIIEAVSENAINR